MNAPLHISSSYFVENNTRYVFVDGNLCDSIEKCYTTLIQQLSLPDYFGNNLDALEEVISDLDWIEEKKVKIIILNTSALLSKDIAKKRDFLQILNTGDNEKLEVICLGTKK